MQNYFIGNKNFLLKDIEVAESCPSNIALIKYWGKYNGQIPANPSISLTLNECKTDTKIKFKVGDVFSVKVFLAGKEENNFSEKIEKYFRSIKTYLPWILEGSYIIDTKNTFPHSSGIASSASGFGALSKCLMKINNEFCGYKDTGTNNYNNETSFLARLGSGSACRSINSGLVVWGKTEEIEGSSDLFAIEYPKSEISPVFKKINDWILLIHKGQKSVSSSIGHGLMDDNPYSKSRFEEAKNKFSNLKTILKEGDLELFMELVEQEALTLHAMMMVSRPSFILMKPKTLEVINKIWEFRKNTRLPLFFTLDAGANIHLLFPSTDIDISNKIGDYIENELLQYSQSGEIIKDYAII